MRERVGRERMAVSLQGQMGREESRGRGQQKTWGRLCDRQFCFPELVLRDPAVRGHSRTHPTLTMPLGPPSGPLAGKQHTPNGETSQSKGPGSVYEHPHESMFDVCC